VVVDAASGHHARPELRLALAGELGYSHSR